MTITIDLPSKTEAELQKRAKHSGQSVDELVNDILERTVRPFSEIVAPIHEAFERSGMTQEELDEFTDELIREVRAEKPLHLR